MGISERKQREKEGRRSSILAHAKTLIYKYGAGACSMQDIADKAEISKAALYIYFKSKEDLLEALADEAQKEFVEYAETKLTPEMSGIESLRMLWLCYIDILGEASDIFIGIGVKNYFLAEKKAGEFVLHSAHASFLKLTKLIEKIIKKGMNDGTLVSSVSPENLTRTVILMASGIIQNITMLPEKMRNSKIIISEMRTVFEIMLRGLASDQTDTSNLSLA